MSKMEESSQAFLSEEPTSTEYEKKLYLVAFLGPTDATKTTQKYICMVEVNLSVLTEAAEQKYDWEGWCERLQSS